MPTMPSDPGVTEPDSYLHLIGAAVCEIGGGTCVVSTREARRLLQSAGVFLDLDWHGVHDSGTGEFPHVNVRMPVVDDVPGAQFGRAFCRTECFRGFLNDMVAWLERRVRAQSQKDEKKAAFLSRDRSGAREHGERKKKARKG